MTSSLAVPYASLRGVQEARISYHPEYASSAGDDAIGLARMAGIELDPWQQVELRHEMGESADWKCPSCTHRAAEPIPCPVHPRAQLIHPWAAFQCCDVVPRQNGKSEKLIVRILAGLFVLEEELQIYSAHLFDTSIEIMRRLVYVIENCDDLLREVKHRGAKVTGIKWSHGEEGVELKGGQRVRFKARTGGGGRGFSCDTLYLDEGMILREQFLGATVPTLSARPNPQIWLAGSPPDEEDPTHDGVVLAKRRKQALERAGSLAYFEHSAEGDHPDTVSQKVLNDPEQWALANPGLGIRITTEYVRNEREAMGARQFAVERLGIGAWPDVSEDAERVISAVVWRTLACEDESQTIVGAKTFAVDINPDRTWASIAVSGMRSDGFAHVAIVAHERGTDWLLDRCIALDAEHPDSRFVLDKRGPAAALILPLQEAELEVVEASTAEYAQACGGFFDAAVHRTLRYPFPQPDLDSALAAARKVPMGDAWKWSRRHSTSADISPVVAATWAHWGATMQPAEPDLRPLVAFR